MFLLFVVYFIEFKDRTNNFVIGSMLMIANCPQCNNPADKKLVCLFFGIVGQQEARCILM